MLQLRLPATTGVWWIRKPSHMQANSTTDGISGPKRHTPIDPNTKKTRAYCFIEFNTPQEAEAAKEKTNRYKLDKSHIFVVNLFHEFDKFMQVPDEWAPPVTKPYAPGENLQMPY